MISGALLLVTAGCTPQPEAVPPKAVPPKAAVTQAIPEAAVPVKQVFNDAPIESVTLEDYSRLEEGGEAITYELDPEEIGKFLSFLYTHKDKLIAMQIPSPPAYEFTIVTSKEKYKATYTHTGSGVFLDDKIHGILPDTQVQEFSNVLKFIEARHGKKAARIESVNPSL